MKGVFICELCGHRTVAKHCRPHLMDAHCMTVEQYSLWLHPEQTGTCFDCGAPTHFNSITRGWSLRCKDCANTARKGENVDGVTDAEATYIANVVLDAMAAFPTPYLTKKLGYSKRTLTLWARQQVRPKREALAVIDKLKLKLESL